MDTHQVPQNVTAFEFHLIGNMTMRQFGYLAASLAFAYLIFVLFATQLPFLAYPIIAISVLIGAAYAFLPIMDRPLDHWTVAFIKAVTNPTIRKYDPARLSSQDSRFKDRLNVYLQQLQDAEDKKPKKTIPLSIHLSTTGPQPVPEESKPKPQHIVEPPEDNDRDEEVEQPSEKPPTPEPAKDNDKQQDKIDTNQTTPEVKSFLQDLDTLAKQQPTNEPATTPTPPPTIQPNNEAVSNTTGQSPVITQPVPVPDSSIPSTEELLSHPAPAPIANEKLPSEEDLDKTVQLARQAQVVQNQIILAEKQIDAIKSSSVTAGVNPQTYTQEFQSVLTTLQKLNQKARDISHELAELSSAEKPNTLINEPAIKPNIIPTLTLTSTANILNGIVTDSQGNYIEGAIIVAHDKQGLPVRALKTNKLGQFIAATPLSSGTYTISVEKDDLSFDVVQVELNDKILNPVVISAKKGVA